MPEENRFAGLSEAVEDDEDESSDEETADEESAVDDTTEGDGVELESVHHGGDDTDTDTEADIGTDLDPDADPGPAPGTPPAESDDDPEPEPGPEPGAETDDLECDPERVEDGDATDDDGDPTAFPFDATEKKTVYVRSETLADVEDARALVDAKLRTDHDVRDLTGREFYDAVFRLAASDTDAVLEAVLEAREESA